VYPSSKNPSLSTLTGVGRLGGLGLGRLGLKTGCFGWATKITFRNRMRPLTLIAQVFIGAARETFTPLMESKAIAFRGGVNLSC